MDHLPKPLRSCLAVCLLLLLAACATNTRLVNSWHDATYTGNRFQRVLVMGFGEDGASRRVFEDQFVKSLQEQGIAAVASYTLVSGLAESDLPQVKEAVVRSGVDGVLTTRLVSVDKRVSFTAAQPVYVPGVSYRRGLYGYYTSVMVMPPSAYNYEVVTLETNLWRVVGESLVWSGTTESFAPEDARQATAGFAEVIVRALQAQGLI